MLIAQRCRTPTRPSSHNSLGTLLKTSKMVASSKYTAPKEDDTSAIIIPTKTDVSPNPAHDREIDLSQMDEQDVKSLQKSGEQRPVLWWAVLFKQDHLLTWKRISHLFPCNLFLFRHRPIHVLLYSRSAQGVTHSQGRGLLRHHEPMP